MKNRRILLTLVLFSVMLLSLLGCSYLVEHTHSYADWESITAPTCSTFGVEKRTCDCGYAEYKTTDALAHTPVTDVKIDATCTSYGKTEGTLQGHSPDPHTYRLSVDDPFFSFVKDGRTYLHFYNGLSCRTLTFLKAPGTPRSARLLNSGEPLAIRIASLPRPFDDASGRSMGPFVSLTGIPVDEYPQEPIMIELEWESCK